MYVNENSYIIKKENERIQRENIVDVFLENFDIMWSGIDLGTNIPNSQFSEKDWEHKIGPRIWDRLPIEHFFCDHNNCDGEIIYKYNNEYFRCDDFTNNHDGLHILFGGCSESEGVGGKLEDTWTNRVYKEIEKTNKLSGFYSIARSGYGWQKIITNFQIYTKKYGFPQFFFVLLPNLGREYRYDANRESYRYYQLYPETYTIDQNGICTTEDNREIASINMHENASILLEQYYKSLIDFKISWELFEQFCKLNGTTILWSTYDPVDSKNFDMLNVGKNFFNMNIDNVDVYISKKENFKITKHSFKYRDGHFGSIIKEYWSQMFLNEIKNRGML